MDAPYYNGPDERDPGCSEDFETCECPACREWRDNREPPGVDGEAFRGGEAAAHRGVRGLVRQLPHLDHVRAQPDRVHQVVPLELVRVRLRSVGAVAETPGDVFGILSPGLLSKSLVVPLSPFPV